MKNSNGWYRPTRKTRRKYEHPSDNRKDNGAKVISAIKKNHDDIVIQDDRIRGGIGALDFSPGNNQSTAYIG